jgi:hypothetical protein
MIRHDTNHVVAFARQLERDYAVIVNTSDKRKPERD